MCTEIATSEVGNWRLSLDDIRSSDANTQLLLLSIDGVDFDVSVNIASLEVLDSIANTICAGGYAELTSKERSFACWELAKLFVFVHESQLTFLLLEHGRRFRISMPAAEAETLIAALYQLKIEAEESSNRARV